VNVTDDSRRIKTRYLGIRLQIHHFLFSLEQNKLFSTKCSVISSIFDKNLLIRNISKKEDCANAN